MPNNNRVMLTDVVLFYMLMIQKQTRLRWRKGEKRRRKRRIAAQRNSEIIAMVEKKKNIQHFWNFKYLLFFFILNEKCSHRFAREFHLNIKLNIHIFVVS